MPPSEPKTRPDGQGVSECGERAAFTTHATRQRQDYNPEVVYDTDEGRDIKGRRHLVEFTEPDTGAED